MPAQNHKRMPRRYALHLDGHALREKLGDAQQLTLCVKKIAEVAQMRILSISQTNIDEAVLVPANRPFEAGISVLALISTSHIALHTWPAVDFFMFDIVSCRRFDPAEIRTVLSDMLQWYSTTRTYNG